MLAGDPCGLACGLSGLGRSEHRWVLAQAMEGYGLLFPPDKMPFFLQTQGALKPCL